MFNIIISCFVVLSSSLFSNEGITKSQEYKNNSSLQWQWAMDSLAQFPMQGSDKVLDVGCGDGKISAFLAQSLPHGVVVGLDISEKMITLASQTFTIGNLLFMQGDATSLVFTEQFDKIVSFCTLHWILDQKAALLSMKRALKIDGKMLLVMPAKNDSNLLYVAERLANSDRWKEYFPHFKNDRIYFSQDEYHELIQECGLKIEDSQCLESIDYFPSKESLIQWLKPLCSFAFHLPEKLQQEFMEEIAESMLKRDILEQKEKIAIPSLKAHYLLSNH